MLNKIDHVAFCVSDLDRAIDFYSEKLQFKLLSKTVDREHHEAFAFLELEGGNLELLQQLDEQGQPLQKASRNVEKPYCPHMALASDDLDKEVARLKQHGIPIIEGPLEIPHSVRWLYFCDPDNNVLEYVQWLTTQNES